MSAVLSGKKLVVCSADKSVETKVGEMVGMKVVSMVALMAER